VARLWASCQANQEGEAALLKGWRMRQVVRLGPLLRLNLSKTGASLSVGKPGLTVNIGRGRRRTTISAPGTGISYSESEPLGGPGDARTEEPAAPAAEPPRARKSLVQVLSNWFSRGQ
jgi:hypothetical protein